MRVRFGYCLSTEDRHDLAAVAQRAEAIGFDTLLAADHVGGDDAPMIVLAAVAHVTEQIRLGTFVLNNDMRNPVQLAWEAATLDRHSGGRFELGLGAGHTPQEYAATGIEMQAASERKLRLCETVDVMRPLLAGEAVTYHGAFVHIDNAQLEPAVQSRLPILVGGNGARLLEYAGSHADIVGLQGLGRTGPDGHSHSVRWDNDRLRDQLAQVQRGASRRGDGRGVECNALVQVVAITGDRQAVYTALAERVDGLKPDELDASPYVLAGTVDEIATKVVRLAEEYGITYFAVRALDDFAPVIRALQ